MRNTFLEQNPFYILEVSPNEKRASIISKAEEKAFFADGNECEDAQTKLLNPEKRLSAELDWFYGLPIEKIIDINKCIGEAREISTDGLDGITRLNAVLHNFSISNYNDYFELGYVILEIDELYGKVELSDLLSIINNCRQQSGMRDVSRDELEREFNRKRDQIRQLISEKTTNLSDEDYIEFITMIAEKFLADEDYNDGIIISDVIDQYEIKMQASIEETADEICAHIERIKELSNDEVVDDNMTGLIRCVEKWDRLVQPLQLKSMASGLPHHSSEEIGFKIRELALFLHNEKGLTEASLELVNAMREFFSELGNLSELFESDSETLTELLEKDEEAENILAEIKALKTIAETINAFSPNIVIDNFITKLKALNKKIRNSSLSYDTKMTARESVASVGRGVVLSLHNDHHRTELAHRIAIVLTGEFGDIPVLNYQLKQDVSTLNQQLDYKSRLRTQQIERENFENAEKAKGLGCLVSVGIFVLILLLIGLSQSDSSNSSYSSNYSKPSSSSSSSSNDYSDYSKPSSSSSISSNNDSDYTETYTVTFNKQNGMAGTSNVTVKNGEAMPSATAPSRYGYIFKGYYSESNGFGTMYYDSNMNSVHNWDKSSGGELYAYWEKKAAEEFTSSAAVGDDVYIDIVSIFPEIGIYTEGSLSYSDFVCKCTTSSGSTVWVYMSCFEYKNNFDSSASTNVLSLYAEKVTFSSSKRIHGIVKKADTVMSGLSSDIGTSLLINFDSVD